MLDCAEFLRDPGSYAIWWKGDGFHSAPVKLQVDSKR
jgi:hypothetical protein